METTHYFDYSLFGSVESYFQKDNLPKMKVGLSKINKLRTSKCWTNMLNTSQ